MTTAESIDFDLPCARCAYNLRTRPRDGACPECGGSIAVSRRAYVIRASPLGRLRLIEPARLHAARRGLTLAIASIAAAGVGLLYGEPRSFLPWWAGSLWLAPPVAVYVLGSWAAWHLAGLWPRVVARVVRGAVVIQLIGFALCFVHVRWLRFYFDLPVPMMWQIEQNVLPMIEALARPMMIAWPPAIAATFGAFVTVLWLAGHRVRAGALALIGLGATGLTAFAWYLLVQAGSGFTQSTVVILMIAPTGAMPGAWLGVRMVGTISALPAEGILMLLAFLGGELVFLTALIAAREAVARAIELGGLGETDAVG